MKTLSCVQGSPEWFAARAGKISASRFPALMARAKNGAKGATWNSLVSELARERISGKKTETFTSAAMQRGIDLEPVAREAYENQFMVSVQEVGMVIHDALDFVTCSPDGLVGSSGLVEIKCLGDDNHIDSLLNNYAVKKYRWQVQGQLWVTQREWCDVTVFHPDFPPGMRLHAFRVYADPDDWSALQRACLEADDEIQRRVDSLLATYPEDGKCLTVMT